MNPRRLWVGLLIFAGCGEVASMQVCDRVGSLCVAEDVGQGLYAGKGATADLDGDGVRDLVSAGSGLSVVWGGSNRREYRFLPNRVRDVEIGDVDGDGDPDIVFITTTPASLRVLENRGDRQLVERPAVTVTGQVESLWVGHLDGDDTLDAVVASHGKGGTLTVLTTGLTRILPIAVGHELGAVEAGDLDGDGHLDIVTADRDDAAIHVLLADGAGFAAPRRISTGLSPEYLQLYDLDGDHQLDVLTHGKGPEIWFHAGDGVGGLAPPRGLVVQERASEGFGAHRDEQGRRWLITLDRFILLASQLDDADLVAGRVVAGGPSYAYSLDMDAGSPLLRGWGYGSRHSLASSYVFTELRHGGPGNESPVLADLDADGELELLSVENRVVLRRQLSDKSWDDPQVLLKSTEHIASFIAVDVTGDGVPDLVIGDDTSSVYVAVGVGDGTVMAAGAPVQLDHTPGLMAALTLAPDEAAAVAIASLDMPGIDVLRFDAAGSLLEQTRPLATATARTLTSADLEGDGDEDLVVLTMNDDQSSSLVIVPRLADGWGPSRTRSLANVHTTTAPDRPLESPALVVGDIDLDDRVDAVLVASGAVVRLLDIGADDPPAPQIHEDPGFDDPDALALADIDGEGPLDLVTCSSGGLGIVLLTADGELRPQAPNNRYVTRCALHVDPQDGRASAAIASDRGYSLLRPDFAPALTSTAGFEGGPGFLTRLVTGDIDADGTADIVVADVPSPGPVGSTAVLWGKADGEPGRATWQAGELFQTAEIAVAPLDDRPGDEVVIAWTHGVTQIWTHDDGALQKLFTTQAALGYDVRGVGVQGRASERSDVILLGRITDELGVIALPRGEDGGFITGADVLLWSGPWIDDESTMTIADLDGDGYEDIAVLHGALEGVAVTWGDRGRAPSVTTVPIPVSARTSLASADLDGDGAAELVVGTERGVVRIGFADREPTPRQTLITESANRGLLLADFDADGTTDLVDANDSRLRISLRSPAGNYFQRLSVFLGSLQLRAADIDGDEILDLVGLFGGTVITRRSTGSPPPPQ